jgi:hypothetical protein
LICFSKEDEELLRKIFVDISKDEMQKHWENIMKFSEDYPYMVAGSPGEEAAFQYIKDVLDEYGVSSEFVRCPLYIKTPKPSTLEVISPREMDIQCTPFRCVVSSPPDGTEGELVYIEAKHIGMVECKDKIILTEEAGLGARVRLREVQDEAKGLVAISRDSFMPTVIHQSSDFSTSGNPTPDNYYLMPQIPMVKVSYKDGQMLKDMCKEGPPYVNMKARVEVGWRKQPQLFAEIKGAKKPEKFILVNGHVDTPLSPGVTDNVSGDVAMLELARVFNKYKDKLDRSIRICFWSGHETGAYAGSVWYNDEYWHDLRYNCVAFLNVDSPGAKGATEFIGEYEANMAASEIKELTAKCILDVTGKKIEKIGWLDRSGDDSFWGTGFPHAYICSTLPDGERDIFVGFSGLGWWWHTPWATLDRGDIDILAMNVKVYADYILRVCNSPILPVDPVHIANDSLEYLNELQTKADKIRAYFNLYPILDRAKEFKAQAEALEKLEKDIISKYERAENKESFDSIFEDINKCLMWVSRHTNLVLHTDAEKTEQMSMEDFGRKPFPELQPILDLAELPLSYPGAKPDFLMLKTKLMRKRNKVEDAFFLSIQEIKEVMNKVKT